MKQFKKLFLILLVVAMILPSATGCSKLIGLLIPEETVDSDNNTQLPEENSATEESKGEETVEDSKEESNTEAESSGNPDTEQTSSDGIAYLSEPVVVAGGSGKKFRVVRPDVLNDVFATLVSALRKPADGFTLDLGVAEEDDNGNTDKEILIGFTCREESKAAMDDLGDDDFSITYVNNKIVVAAHNADRLEEAVNFLVEKLLKVEGKKLLYVGDYIYRSDSEMMIGEGESIADYKIVCGHDNLYMAAYEIQTYIKDKYGAELKIIFDTKPKEGKEIVLGNAANREISKLADELTYSQGIVAVQDKDLLIATKDSVDTTMLFDAFLNEYLSGVYTDRFNFRADYTDKVDNIYLGVFKDPAAFTQGSDIRVMSINVLVDIWADTPAVKGRQGTIGQVIKHYMPDVVGLQEMSINWHNALKKELKNTPYKLINTEHDYVHSKYGNTNFTPILYNSETLTLIECDTAEYTEAGNRYMKTMSYAYFEHIESGKRFVLLNTHYEAPGNNPDEKAENLEYRNYQTADMVKMIAELQAKYDCPLISTGDFNTTEGSDKTGTHAPYWNLVEQASLSDAKYTADKIVRACSTWHELGQSASVTSPGSFDHIFGDSRIKFTYFNTLIDKVLLTATDHCPIFADVILN